MKLCRRVLPLLLIFCLVSCRPDGQYTRRSNGDVVTPDGTTYTFVASEDTVCAWGERTFLGKIAGEKPIFIRDGTEMKTGMYSLESDPERRLLVRVYPDNESLAYYRRSDLPDLTLSADTCVRLVLIGGNFDFRNPNPIEQQVGIVSPGEAQRFLSDLRTQPTAEEAGLGRLASGGENEGRRYGTVYGFLEGETQFALLFPVNAYNGDTAFTMRLDRKDYVIPDTWMFQLEN